MTTFEQTIRSKGRPLFGAAVQSYNTTFVEILGLVGYDVLWIEMEHMPITFGQAADLCRVARGAGLLTFLRIPDTRRENVLKAAECGPDIIDLPMGNSPEVLRELVTHARFAPEGDRGFFGSSRAIRYSLEGGMVEARERINRELCLLSQIETREAVERAEELCDVQGVNGIMIGPGDLSASLGVPGQTSHPTVVTAIERAVKVASDRGKLVVFAGGADKIVEWAAKGVQLFFLGGECSFIGDAARRAMRSAMDQVESERGGNSN